MNELFKDIVREALASNPNIRGLEYLNEASINRIMKMGDENGLIIISSNRSKISGDFDSDFDTIGDEDSNTLLKQYADSRNYEKFDKEKLFSDFNSEDSGKWLKDRNKSCDKELKNDIINAGYSYTPVFGGYHGGDDVVDDFEPSYIIYNKKKDGSDGSMYDLVQFGIEMAKKYSQDSFCVKMPGKPAFYINQNGEKINKSESDDVKFNDNSQEFYTTTSRKKDNPQRFTYDIKFPEPEDNDNFIPQKMFEGKLYAKNIEYVDRMRRRDLGEIFL